MSDMVDVRTTAYTWGGTMLGREIGQWGRFIYLCILFCSDMTLSQQKYTYNTEMMRKMEWKLVKLEW